MKCFKSIQKNISALGLVPNPQPNNQPLWNSRQILCTAIHIADTIGMTSYIVFEAEEIDEYMEAIYSLTAVISMEVAYFGFVYKNDKLFNFFEIFSKEITTSKQFLKIEL